MKTAREMYREYKPPDHEGALAVGRAFLEQDGDLPASVWHTLGALQDDPNATWNALTDMRAEHFKKLGKQAPPYGGDWR